MSDIVHNPNQADGLFWSSLLDAFYMTHAGIYNDWTALSQQELSLFINLHVFKN